VLLRCPTCQARFAEGVPACPHDGTALSPPPPDPLIGTYLDPRLRVLSRIGEGGMGAVYAAEHVGIGKQVAIKILHERLADRDEVARRLQAEARHASAIRNPHIVEIFDIGKTEDGRSFVVMELLSGESLAHRLARRGALPPAEVLDMARQLADALRAAHAHGIVHRDVKPENIFLCERDGGTFVKVLDFGIAKALRRGDDEPRLTLTGAGLIMGTPLYMSPEQARGDENLDHRIDIYAFGVLLYECLTGEVPFASNNYLGVINRILTHVPEPPRKRRPEANIPADLEAVVLRAMAPDRDARYQSMAEVEADLARVAAGSPLTPSRPRRGRGLTLAGVLILGLVLVGVLLVRPLRAPSGPGPGPLLPSAREPGPDLSPVQAQTAAPDLAPAAVSTPDLASAPEVTPPPERPRPRPVRPPPPPPSPGLDSLPPEDEQAPNPYRSAVQKRP
jgi:serine/threonine-protein kinase